MEIIAPSFSAKDLKAAFDLADADSSGSISRKEFLARAHQYQSLSEKMEAGDIGPRRSVSSAPDKRQQARMKNMTTEEQKLAEELFSICDKDDNGTLDLKEFKKVRSPPPAGRGRCMQQVIIGPRKCR